MNFDMAGEMVEMENIRTTSVIVADDVASGGPEARDKRRGVAGMIYCFKIAGAKAETKASLDEVTATAQKAADHCRSSEWLSHLVSSRPPGAPRFQSGERNGDWHGHPRRARRPPGSLRPADEIVQEMLDVLLADMPLGSGDRVSVLCNSLGATPLEELYISYRYNRQGIDGERM